MKEIIAHQIEGARRQLSHLETWLQEYQTVRGVGAARVASELAASNLRLAKLFDDDKLSLGRLKPHEKS